MLDVLRALNGYLRKLALAGWYILFPVAFFKLSHGVFTHWKNGAFSIEDAVVVFVLFIWTWLAYRFMGMPAGGALVAIAYIAYSLSGN